MNILDMEFILTKDSLTVLFDGDKNAITVKCNLLEELYKLQFTFEGEEYNFNMMLVNKDKFILVDEKRNDVLYMEREK